MRAIKSLLCNALGFILLAIVYITCPLWLPIAAFGHWFAERRELKTLKSLGRFLNWSALLCQTKNGKQGTLIIEDGLKSPTRYWWTPDDILSKSPHPVPSVEIDPLDLMDNPFPDWIWDHYTGPKGSAIFVNRPKSHQASLDGLGFIRIVRTLRCYRPKAK